MKTTCEEPEVIEVEEDEEIVFLGAHPTILRKRRDFAVIDVEDDGIIVLDDIEDAPVGPVSKSDMKNSVFDVTEDKSNVIVIQDDEIVDLEADNNVSGRNENNQQSKVMDGTQSTESVSITSSASTAEIEIVDLDTLEPISLEVFYDWDARITKKLRSFWPTDNMEVFFRFMHEYLKSLQDVSENCEELLLEKVFRHIYFLYSYYMDMDVSNEEFYLKAMEDILRIYVDLELKAVALMKKPPKRRMLDELSKKIFLALKLFLLKYDNYILHVLIKVDPEGPSTRRILSKIYRHFVSATCSSVQDLAKPYFDYTNGREKVHLRSIDKLEEDDDDDMSWGEWDNEEMQSSDVFIQFMKDIGRNSPTNEQDINMETSIMETNAIVDSLLLKSCAEKAAESTEEIGDSNVKLQLLVSLMPPKEILSKCLSKQNSAKRKTSETIDEVPKHSPLTLLSIKALKENEAQDEISQNQNSIPHNPNNLNSAVDTSISKSPIDSEPEFSNSPNFLEDTNELLEHCLQESEETSEKVVKDLSFLSDHSNFYCKEENEGQDETSQNKNSILLHNPNNLNRAVDTSISKSPTDPEFEFSCSPNFLEDTKKLLAELPTAVPESYDFNKNLTNEVFLKIKSETKLPLKKRKLAITSEEEDDISYPATPMISIAEVEGQMQKLQPTRRIKTPAERKEMPPFLVNNEPNDFSPIITDLFNINTYNNPTINYHMNNVPVPLINMSHGSYYSIPPILLPFSNFKQPNNRRKRPFKPLYHLYKRT